MMTKAVPKAPEPPAEQTLYVFSPDPDDQVYRIQKDQLESRLEVLRQHNVVVAEIFENCGGRIGDNVIPPERVDGIRQRFHIPQGRFRVMLVDKNAHVKLIADSCVSCEEVLMRLSQPHPLVDEFFE